MLPVSTHPGASVVMGMTMPGVLFGNLATSTIVGTVMITLSSSPGVVVTWSLSAVSGSS